MTTSLRDPNAVPTTDPAAIAEAILRQAAQAWNEGDGTVARLLAHGCVMAVATSTLDAPHGPLRGVNHSRITMLLAAQDGDWGITAFHNTLVSQGG